ncbi:MAG: response regulator [Oscillospiraceae bacterium]|nr:response regulator [Oscillospiraceae bacterium]
MIPFFDKHGSVPLRRLVSLIIAMLLMSGILSVTACAESDKSTVRVGYYENELFQEGAEEGAAKTGYAYEYYRKLSEYTGWRYEYIYGNFGELYQMLLDGEIDLLAGLAWREDRAGQIGYPTAVMGSEIYYLVKHEENPDITADPTTLNGCRIGVLESAMVDTLRQYLEDRQVSAEIVAFKDYTELFRAFDAHTIEVLAAESDGAHAREHAEVLGGFGSSDYYLCVNIRRPELLDTLNTAQTRLAAEEPNYLNLLRAKYFSTSVTARAFSQAEREWMNTHTALHVGYLDRYLPYSDTDAGGEATGIVRDIIPAILQTLEMQNISVTYTGYRSYDDMISGIAAGEIDAAFPVGGGLYYAEENGIYQSNAVSSSPAELVYKGEFSEKTTEHFAVNENNRMQYYFVRTNYPDAEITFYPSSEECLDAVLAGKAGCMTLNGLRANDILRNRRYEDLSLRQTSYNDARCFGVEIGNEGLLKLLNRGINILGGDYAQNISYRYTGGLYTYDFTDALMDHMALVGTVLLVAALVVFLLVRDVRRTRREVREKEAARIELEEKNRELAQSQKALSDALVAAEHANHAKTAFLNNMSHDIRTPMNAIVGFTALAASHIDNREQVQDYLGKISVSSQHLLSLINDVLDMSRIESGKVTIEEKDVHLPDVIHDLRTIIQSSIDSKQMELFIDTQDVVHEEIVTDKLRLNQILLNILSNAIKFTPAGGTISFRVIEKPSPAEKLANFEFRIRDNGIGMSEEFQKTIFEAFTREKTSTVSGIQGTGLGMAITKNIVDMMGGVITVHSTEGKGSEFIVELPCRISSVSTKSEPLPELKGLRALVADDDTHTCLSVCSMLRQIGMRPDWTNRGKEAVIRAREAVEQADEFQVYIIDWLMPDLNGIETVRRIRKVIGNSVPIIILTAYDWADIEEEAREAGVTAFCSKPLFMSGLRNVLAQPFTASKDRQPEPSEETPDFSGKRVLLAEDNAMNQMIAENILSSVGFAVEIACDGTEAVEKVKSAPAGYYDLILMDIQMPKMDGHEAAKQIRALEDRQKAGIPIVAVTANAFEEDRKAALETGMNGHLAKPYDIPTIMATLQTLLK